MDLPERANEALDNLGKIYAMTRGIIDLLEISWRESRRQRGTLGEFSRTLGSSHTSQRKNCTQ